MKENYPFYSPPTSLSLSLSLSQLRYQPPTLCAPPFDPSPRRSQPCLLRRNHPRTENTAEPTCSRAEMPSTFQREECLASLSRAPTFRPLHIPHSTSPLLLHRAPFRPVSFSFLVLDLPSAVDVPTPLRARAHSFARAIRKIHN